MLIIVIAICAILSVTLVIVLLPPAGAAGERKAFIVCSANDFHGSEEEDDFNNGFDSNFSADTGKWWPRVGEDVNINFIDALQLVSMGTPTYFEMVYNWTDHYSLSEYWYYNLSANVTIETMINGAGCQVGLEWWNSSNQVVRTDWSNAINVSPGLTKINVEGVCNNDTNNEITQLKLILAVTGDWPGGQSVIFDDVKVDRWITTNLTHPFNGGPPPPQRNLNCDGFPAQALQVYKILKDHGYTDDNIYFMLYYKDDTDGVIDIMQGDGIANDLVGAVLDVENDSVTASNVKQQLNVSVAGSFASGIRPNDHLIIYMVDHGSNRVLADRNATFHFEADGSFITEFEFYDLVSEIKCEQMMINLDCCFSGNFLNQNSSIGAAWYDLPNCVFVSAAANVLSWYWVDNVNGDMFAGSWFFHVFWDQLDQDQTINTAFNTAQNFVPAGKGMPLALIQVPMMQDNLGIAGTWTLNTLP